MRHLHVFDPYKGCWRRILVCTHRDYLYGALVLVVVAKKKTPTRNGNALRAFGAAKQ